MIKRFAISIGLLCALLVAAPRAIHVHAQTPIASVGLTSSPTVTGCQSIAVYTLCLYGPSTAPNLAVSSNGGTFMTVQGVAGPIGATGAQGPAGPIGATGAQGPAGPAGPAGPGPAVTSINGKTGAVTLSATIQ